MQHPWNLDTFYFQRCGNKGEGLSGESGRGRGFLEKNSSQLGRKQSPDSTLSKVTSSSLSCQPPPPPRGVAGGRRQVLRALCVDCPPSLRILQPAFDFLAFGTFHFVDLLFLTLDNLCPQKWTVALEKSVQTLIPASRICYNIIKWFSLTNLFPWVFRLQILLAPTGQLRLIPRLFPNQPPSPASLSTNLGCEALCSLHPTLSFFKNVPLKKKKKKLF